MIGIRGGCVYMYYERLDMRKSVNGLSQLINDEFGMNPGTGNMFVFFNKGRDRVKVLFWHLNGYCLFYKRLEADKFQMSLGKTGLEEISRRQLDWVLEGLNIEEVQGHPERQYGDHF